MNWRNGVNLTLTGIKKRVGKGWGKIIDKMIKEIMMLNWDGVVFNVGSRDGSLVFDIRSSDDKINQVIISAKIESLITCEKCGKKGLRHGDKNKGMDIITLCSKHRREREKEWKTKM